MLAAVCCNSPFNMRAVSHHLNQFLVSRTYPWNPSCKTVSVQSGECELDNNLKVSFINSDMTKETHGLLIVKKNWDTNKRQLLL